MITDSKGNKWYKGNLHTHTTSSDGAVSPDEAIKLYNGLGYDFVALTDHWHVNEPGEYNGTLILSGVEYDISVDGCYHVVGYGLDFKQQYRNVPYIGVMKPEIYENAD